MLPDDVARRLIQVRLLLDRDEGLAMNHLVSSPNPNPPAGTHPDHADVLRVAGGFVLGVVRVAQRPSMAGLDPFAAVGSGPEPQARNGYVVGDVHSVDPLVLSGVDGSVWLVDGEPGGHWPEGTASRRLADSLAEFVREHVFGPRYRELTEIPDDEWADVASRLDEEQPLIEYVRYEATEPTRRMTYPDVFALANGLAHSGRLTPEDLARWRSHTDLVKDACADRAAADSSAYDRNRHPDARTYLRADARHLLDIVLGCLDLLERYGVGWREIRTYDPGRILCADELRVVAEPRRDPC